MKRFGWLGALILAVWLPAFAGPAVNGPGLFQTPMMLDDMSTPGGSMEVYNSKDELIVDVSFDDGWLIHELQMYVEPYKEGEELAVPEKKGTIALNKFPHKREYDSPPAAASMVVPFAELFEDGFRWGEPDQHKRTMAVVMHADLVMLDDGGEEIARSDAWASGEIEVPYSKNGTGFVYRMAHPRKAHFIDSPVGGLGVLTPTFSGKTDASGGFDYFPGERAELFIGEHAIGNPLADHKISPLDIFEQADTDDVRVINMARLLQSLDSEATPENGIAITESVEACLNGAMDDLGLTAFDFADSAEIDSIINSTVGKCSGLVVVSAEDAKENLEKTLNSDMFRKNISRTPELGSSKSKLNVMGVWFPALRANGDPATFTDDSGTVVEGIPYYYVDPETSTKELVRVATEAKPLIITYTDADPGTGAHDVWAAVSRDDGNTWKRKNLSRMGDRSSFELADGTPFYGECKKPVFQVKGNKILVAWTSKFARGGKPRYSIVSCAEEDDDCKAIDYPFDDAYAVDDIWGVAGPQRSHDYTDDGYPEVGEVPFSAVWVARGVIATQAEIDKGIYDGLTVIDDKGTEDPSDDETRDEVQAGDILWYKPERLTSGRRDANQVFMGASDGAGFAIAWQEDPGGLRPGEAKGPGPGWGGATTNHKTDIWYSYVTWGDFAKVDANFVPGGDPEHEFNIGRPKALVPMSLPVRISDNDAVNTDNLLVELDEDGLPKLDENGDFIPILNDEAISEDADGAHRYGYMLDRLYPETPLWNWDGSIYEEGDDASAWIPGSGTLYEFINQQGETKRVVVTADGRALDGNTGASRPNLFLQTYTVKGDDPTTTKVEVEYKSAWAIMAYEETKGMGSGPPDDTGEGEEPQDGSGYDPYALVPDEGKNAIYHSFDFRTPDLVSAGTILNLPETDEYGEPLFVVEPDYLGSVQNTDGTYTPIDNPAAGQLITDWKGYPQLAYENARRPRFILQSKAAAFGGTKLDGSFKNPENSGTVLIVLYKEGQEGQGRPSDIMARRFVVKKPDGTIKGGNPWSPANVLPGAQNVSTVVPGLTWVNPERDPDAKGDGVKVCDWTQPEEALGYKSGENPYEDARAHRGAIRGDFVVMGYSYTPNWAAARNAHDKYDFYIRRSFDGGATWSTDPFAGADVVHEDIFINPDGLSGADLAASSAPLLDEEGNDITEATKHYTVSTTYGPGVYEPARNVSLIKNNKVSVIEPRIVAVPGTIKIDGEWTGIPEDKQDPDVFYIAYGTSTNLPFVEKAPEDLFLSFSQDRGNTLVMDTWVVNPDSTGNWAGETVNRRQPAQILQKSKYPDPHRLHYKRPTEKERFFRFPPETKNLTPCALRAL
ncbi:MAG: choice-of-anchor O protein [Planctomycetes bacterium]|nr:choice-of-anchor O protein [Planctomycetota bacterium]